MLFVVIIVAAICSPSAAITATTSFTIRDSDPALWTLGGGKQAGGGRRFRIFRCGGSGSP